MSTAASTTDVASVSDHDRLVPAWVPAAVLVLLWAIALPSTWHYGNPDGPSYAVIAELWATGRWGTAVNAYWGPLLSWLSVPLLWVGIEPLLALRLVLLAGALATLVPLRSLSRRAGASVAATDALLLAVAPFLVYNALFGLYPDVLLAAALLRSIDLLTRPRATQRRDLPLRAGAWAGVAYLAKAYAVPVALVVLPLVAMLHLARRPRPSNGALARTAGLAVAGFVVVAGAWAAVLSVSYGEPTFSTSAGFNAELVAPGSAGNPYNVAGLYEPPRPDAVSAWEEPSELPVPRRRSAEEAGAAGDGPGSVDGAGGREVMLHRLELAVANARIVVGSLVRRGLPVLALAAVVVVAAVRRRQPPDPALSGPLAAGVVFVAGLTLIIAIERYTWFAVLAAVPAAAVGLDLVLTAGRRRWLPVLAGALFVLVAATSVHGLLPRWNAMQEVTVAAEAIEAAGGLDGRVATAGSWQETHLLCFRVGCQYLGRPGASDAGAVADELHAAGVDHLVVWGRDAEVIDGVDVDEGTLTVFAVSPDGLRPTLRVAAGRASVATRTSLQTADR